MYIMIIPFNNKSAIYSFSIKDVCKLNNLPDDTILYQLDNDTKLSDLFGPAGTLTSRLLKLCREKLTLKSLRIIDNRNQEIKELKSKNQSLENTIISREKEINKLIALVNEYNREIDELEQKEIDDILQRMISLENDVKKLKESNIQIIKANVQNIKANVQIIKAIIEEKRHKYTTNYISA